MRNVHLASLCLVAASAFPALGTTITTTSYSQWKTSSYITGSVTVDTLSSLPYGTIYNTASGVTYGGYTFTGPDGASWILKAGEAQGYYGLLGAQDGAGAVDVTVPGNAFFIWAVASNSTSDPLQLTLSDGTTVDFTGAIGISSSSALNWAKISPTEAGDGVLLYEVDFAISSLTQTGGGNPPSGTPQAPEAATIALVGGGILVLFGARRKLTLKLAM